MYGPSKRNVVCKIKTLCEFKIVVFVRKLKAGGRYYDDLKLLGAMKVNLIKNNK